MSEAPSYQGAEEFTSRTSDLNALHFLFQRLLKGVWTTMPVQVKAVSSSGGVAPIGTVDLQPLVHQIDGRGNSVPHGVIAGVPYSRLQGGANAIILDPQVGDIGLAAFAMRDISAVIAKGAPNIPGSRRAYDPSDAIYLFSIYGGNPTQYVRFSSAGIDVVSPTKVTVQAPEVDVTATTKAVVTAPEVDVTASTKAVVTTPECDLISDNVNLGGTGGKKVVLDGDPVIGGSGGTVQASSTKVKAL